jgi:small subunit ribosomal protein S6
MKRKKRYDKRLYEAMFVVEPQAAATQWTQVAQEIEGVLLRHGATVVRLDRWDERKLAYPIKKRQRAGYALCYFESPPPAITKIRADLALSETLLRTLILTFEGTPKEPTPAPTPVPVETATA